MLIHVGSGSTFLEVQKLQAKKIVLLSSKKIFMVDIFSSHRQKRQNPKKQTNRHTKKQKGEKSKIVAACQNVSQGTKAISDGRAGQLIRLAGDTLQEFKLFVYHFGCPTFTEH